MGNQKYSFSNSTEKFFGSGTVILFRCEGENGFPLISVSENAEDILGFTPSYFLEQEHGWSNRIHPHDKEKVFERFKRVISEGGGTINEYRFKRKDGTYIWLRDELKLIEEEGSPIVYGSSFEITERKKAELALKKSKQQYQSVVDHIKDVTYSADEKGRITFLNKPWIERTGFGIEESIDQPFWNFVHHEDKCRFKDVFQRLLNGSQESATKTIRFLKKNGDFFWAEVYANRLQNKEIDSQVINGTVIDISSDLARRRQKEAINRQLEERVEQRSEELKDEIEKRKKIESQLQQRLSYEQAISKISSLLFESTAPEALEKSLRVLQQVTESDRVYIYKNVEEDGELYLDPVVEVCADDVESVVEGGDERFRYSQIEWWYQKLKNNEIINATINDFPENERKILKSENVQSVLVIPLIVSGEWFGYIGFTDTTKKHYWHKNEVRVLKTAADIISAFEKRKMIEKSLLEQRNYTETILDSLPSIYLLMDADLEFVQWNANAERKTQYSGKELKEKSAFDLIVPEEHEKLRQATEDVKIGENQGAELKLLTKTGKEIPYFWRGYFIEVAGKEYFLCVGLDISQQKQAEKELIEEKHFNETLIESLPGVFYMLDKKGNYLRWNKNFEDELGYDSDELKNMHVADYFRKEEYEKISKEISTVFEKGEAETEAVVVTKTGKEVPYFLTGKLLSRNNEEYLIGVGHDISEQKKAREELRKSEELFRNLFLLAPAAIVMVKPDNKVQNINESFENLFGYSEEELKGKDIDQVLVPETEFEGAPKMSGSSSTMDKFHKEAQRLTKDGNLVDVFVASIPVYVDSQLIAGFGMYIDITEQKKYEEEIYTSLKEKQVLLQEIHHRVKNNLAVVSGLIQLQMYETDNPVVKETLKESESRIQTMALIHEKLYQSKNLSRISCKSYIGDLVETIKKTNESGKDIRIRKDIEDVELSINKAVPFALLVNEMVTNSFKHAFDGRQEGEIRMSLDQNNGQAKVYISDDGVGLPEDFEPKDRESLGMTLIDNFMSQLDAEGEMGSDDGTFIRLTFDIEDNNSSDSALLS